MELPKTPTMSLAGKRAVVTGASSGIGLAAAVALGEAGADVMLIARRAALLKDLASAMQQVGMTATALPLDITDIPVMQDQIATAGPFDILVNSAGMARHGPALETTPDDFDAVTGVNLKSAYFLAQAVATGLIAASKPGSLITISSQMALVGGVDLSLIHISEPTRPY